MLEIAKTFLAVGLLPETRWELTVLSQTLAGGEVFAAASALGLDFRLFMPNLLPRTYANPVCAKA